MKLFKKPNSKFYWYDFTSRGCRYRGSTQETKLVTWSTRVVTTPIARSNLYTGYTESVEKLRDPATVAALEWYGGDIAPYAIPNFRLDYAPVDSVVPRSWWRSVARPWRALEGGQRRPASSGSNNSLPKGFELLRENEEFEPG